MTSFCPACEDIIATKKNNIFCAEHRISIYQVYRVNKLAMNNSVRFYGICSLCNEKKCDTEICTFCHKLINRYDHNIALIRTFKNSEKII